MMKRSWRVQDWLNSRHLMIVRGLFGGDEERIGKAGSDGKSGKGGDQKKNAPWANGAILTKTMVLMVHMSTVYAIVFLMSPRLPLRRPFNPLTLNVFPV